MGGDGVVGAISERCRTGKRCLAAIVVWIGRAGGCGEREKGSSA